MVGSPFLTKIVAARKRRVQEAKERIPLDTLRQSAEARSGHRDFAGALTRGGFGVIAELKRASPSRGLICAGYRPREIAESYERGGAAALSVLTEEEFFLGSLDHLETVRKSVRLPVLRKDFIVDDYQVYESTAAGADALLLIVAALADNDLKRLLELSAQLKIAPLVEVHTGTELDRALSAGARIIGVNNRDLNTFEVDLETSFRLREKIPASSLAISESGIKSGRDLERLAAAGFNAVLIGEHLMSSGDPGSALEKLLESAPSLRMART
jgi:indole-3-glycerol phosphate synthase